MALRTSQPSMSGLLKYATYLASNSASDSFLPWPWRTAIEAVMKRWCQFVSLKGKKDSREEKKRKNVTINISFLFIDIVEIFFHLYKLFNIFVKPEFILYNKMSNYTHEKNM